MGVQRKAADDLTRAVMAKVGASDRNEVKCPREKTFMTPCVARDGKLAVADEGVCVACGEVPSELLAELKARQEQEQPEQ